MSEILRYNVSRFFFFFNSKCKLSLKLESGSHLVSKKAKLASMFIVPHGQALTPKKSLPHSCVHTGVCLSVLIMP